RIARDAGRPLFRRTGGLMLGPPGGELVAGAIQSAETHGLPYEVLDPPQVRRRFPVFAVDEGNVAVLEPRAGFLDPEAAVASCLALAVRDGATVLDRTVATGWRRAGDAVVVGTDGGEVSCGRLILAAGPWLPALVEGAGLPLAVERQVMGWFAPADPPGALGPDAMPVFIWEWESGRFFYGIPDHGPGLKLARHHEGVPTTPETVDRAPRPDDIEPLERLHRRFLPGRVGALREAAVCLYTNTPDRHFVLGPWPGEPRVLLASPCSGHGFKFASALGEVLADLATGVVPGFDLTPFRPDRFA
ncbi:MAG TPA: N-methyl-L-tryptophan oxidase, partial [Gemmatimonadales bacterium]|nr:N-methyl-L-tryptophan oxidase [Gemmatimonadales bacterium]